MLPGNAAPFEVGRSHPGNGATTTMDYRFEILAPITEQEALAQVAEMGFHGLAFDQDLKEDESLHWHEFDSVSFVIAGTGRFADEQGHVTEVGPGCRLQAPAGWLHRSLAGPPYRVVIGTNLPGSQWTAPLNKDPADRPASLAV
jgi:mannose-6-phosphate isomerase-like protein (cupin superfamily)